VASEAGLTVDIFMAGRVCLLGEHSDWVRLCVGVKRTLPIRMSISRLVRTCSQAGSYRHFNKDITQGCTIVCPTNQGIRGKATRAASIRLVSERVDVTRTVCGSLSHAGTHTLQADITDSVFSSELDREELLKGRFPVPSLHGRTQSHTRPCATASAVARAGGYWSYVAGTCYTMLTNFEVAGISIVLTEQSLPSGKGLSSCVCRGPPSSALDV